MKSCLKTVKSIKIYTTRRYTDKEGFFMNKPTQERPPINMPGGRGKGPGAMMRPKEKPKDAKAVLKKLINYIAANKYLFYILILVMVFITVLNLAIPSIQGAAINTIKIKDGRVTLQHDKFIVLLVLLAFFYVLSSLFQYLQGIFSAKLSQTTVRDLRRDLFAKIVKLPIKYLDTHQHGDIMSRMTNDVENISNSISQSIGSLISGVLTIVGTLVIMLCYSPLLTAVSMITIFLTVVTSGFMARNMRKFFSRQQRLMGELNGHIEETVTGFRTIAAFGKEDAEKARFDEISDELKSCAVRAQILGGSMGPLMNVISNLGFLLVAASGGYLAMKQVIAIGTIQAFLIYTKQFSRPVNEIANQFAQIQTALAGAERIFAIMEEPDETDDGTKIIDVSGSVDFNNIDFSYVPGEQVLKNFDLHIKKGEKIALVGATGSGKTTVVNLLTGFYAPDSGSIKLDGVDIRDIPKAELRKNIAIVLQDTVLFSDTVEKNIQYGKEEAAFDEIKHAAQTANADIFIERLNDGYNTELTESGANLSQGQRQLLSIARAVLANPKILILDEATSSVDTRTEMHIQQAMLALMENRTSIIIAHRLSTIRDADMIVVVDNGKIVEMGNHENLLEKKGCYYQLYQSQFAGNKT